MLHPQRLFTPTPASSDLLGHAPFLVRARTERDSGREETSQVALGAYLLARLLDRLFERADRPDEDDGFGWQLQSTKRFLGELPGGEVEVAHLQGILDSVERNPRPSGAGLRTSLVAYAYYLEQEGRYAEALELLGAAARTYPAAASVQDFTALGLFVGRLNRFLSRWEAATAAYEAAEAAAEGAGDQRSALLARLGRANVVRGQGNLPHARRDVESILEAASPPELADVRARAYSDLSAVLDRQGEIEASVLAAYRAFTACSEEPEQWRLLANLGGMLARSGANAAARDALTVVVTRSRAFASRTNALIELMSLEAGEGNELAFRRHWQEASALTERMAPSMAVDFRYHAGRGFARLGRVERGRRLLQEALELSECYRLNEWFFRVEQALEALAQGPPAPAPDLTPAGEVESPAMAEVRSGLRELAELATV